MGKQRRHEQTPPETPEHRLWRQAIDWVVALFRAMKRWPSQETIELSGHLRVVAVSVAAQITEAWLRPQAKQGWPSLMKARRDLEEAETLLIVARRLGYLTGRQATTLAGGVLALRMALEEWTQLPARRRARTR